MCMINGNYGYNRHKRCLNATVKPSATIIGIDEHCDGDSTTVLTGSEMDVHNNDHIVFYNENNSMFFDINTSNISFPNEIWIRVSDTEIALKVSMLLPIVIVGIIGNSILLYIICRYRALRTPTNLIIANMATADLLNLLFCPWLFLINDFYQSYQLGVMGCKMEGFLECFLLLTSVFNLSVVSYDRLTAIVLPRETRLKKRRAKIIMVVTWLVSLILASPLFIFRVYVERPWNDFLETYCRDTKLFHAFTSVYWHIILTLVVWLPLALMLICYTAIFIKINKYEQEVLKREHPFAVRYKTKVAKTMFIVVITFITCRVPFTTLIFIRTLVLNKNYVINQADGAYLIISFIAKYLIFVNAAVNPIIYGLTNDNFKRAFRNTTLSKCIFGPPITEAPKKLIVNVVDPCNNHKEKLFNLHVRNNSLEFDISSHSNDLAVRKYVNFTNNQS